MLFLLTPLVCLQVQLWPHSCFHSYDLFSAGSNLFQKSPLKMEFILDQTYPISLSFGIKGWHFEVHTTESCLLQMSDLLFDLLGHFRRSSQSPEGYSLYFTSICTQKLRLGVWLMPQYRTTQLFLGNKSVICFWIKKIEDEKMLSKMFLEPFPLLEKSPVGGKKGDKQIRSNLSGRGQASATILPPSVWEKRPLCILWLMSPQSKT